MMVQTFITGPEVVAWGRGGLRLIVKAMRSSTEPVSHAKTG
jgi:hypothetical protein